MSGRTMAGFPPRDNPTQATGGLEWGTPDSYFEPVSNLASGGISSALLLMPTKMDLGIMQ